METTVPSFPQSNLTLEQQVVRLQALLEATRQVHSTIRAKEVLQQAARILVRELELEGAVFQDPTTGEALVQYGEMPPPPWEDCIRFPLQAKDKRLLAELLVSGSDCVKFSVFEQDFVEGLALQTAVALENATLHERDLEWARVQQDLDAARAVQRSLLPKAMPHVEGFSIAGRQSTCYEVGGDYLDAVALPDGSHLLVVADVAGKGLASAIVATSFRAALRSLATQPLSLEEIAARLGQQHWDEGSEARRRYMTTLLLRIQPESDRIQVVNAGHNPAALLRPDGSLTMLSASGVPLGMLPEVRYTTQTADFPPGSRLLLYTDGLTEVFRDEEEFGEERLFEAFQELSSSDADQILETVWNILAKFSGDAPQTDDMTALAVCRR